MMHAKGLLIDFRTRFIIRPSGMSQAKNQAGPGIDSKEKPGFGARSYPARRNSC
jgi:hypothetical protein